MYNTKITTPIFQLPRSNAKTIDDVSFVYLKQFNNIPVVGGNFSITLSGTDTWAFTAVDINSSRENIMVTLETDTTIGVVPHKKGKIEDFYATGPRTVAMPSNQSLNFAFGEAMTGSPTVSVTVSVRSISPRNNKTLLKDRYVRINTHINLGTPVVEGLNETFYYYSLGVHDIISLDKVWMSTGDHNAFGLATEQLMNDSTDWIDITDQVTLVDGTGDSRYGIAQIKVTKAFHDLYTDKAIIIKLSFFSHGTEGGYYTVDSYPLPEENEEPTSSQISWENIPVYVSTSNTRYNLRDTIDFRTTIALGTENGNPVGAIAGSSITPQTATTNPSLPTTFMAGAVTPKVNGTFIADIEYHLPRIDRIVLDQEGIFQAIEGVSSDQPTSPKEPDNSMTLGYVNIPAYPSLSPYYARIINRPEYATSVVAVDNRRFTMKNIGQIQERLDKLEYGTSLSALEQGAKNLQILSSAGEERYKCGILVDPFLGHNVGNVFDTNYSCSIADGILRPSLSVDNIDFVYSSLGSSNLMRTAKDMIIVVRQLLSAPEYQIGITITSSGIGSGELVHNVPLAQNDTYRWVRLYMENVEGSFGKNNSINNVSGIITYSGMSEGTLPSTLRPDLVSTPTGGTDSAGVVYPNENRTVPEGMLITLPYVHAKYIQNPYASQTRNCSSPILFTYDGVVELTPDVDSWVDTDVYAEVQLNKNNLLDNWKNLRKAWGTHWKFWDSIWHPKHTKVDIDDKNTQRTVALTSNQRQATEGIGFTLSQDLRNNVIPFIRSRVITFVGKNLKANTKVNAFFDGVNVTEHCKLGADSAYGTNPLITDSAGNIVGQFRIPAETFISGSKLFVITDNQTDPRSSDKTVTASAMYVVDGRTSYDNRSVLSTKTPKVTFERQLQTQNSVVARQVTIGMVADTSDPLAQTFFVSNNDNGALATKIDVYFYKKSKIASITLQLREVVNGYPSDTILPYSSVTLEPKDINTSVDGSAVTEFKFISPVYLKNNTEYCFVLIPTGNNDEYAIWESEVGKNVYGTTTIIDKQPNAGTLFTVGNNRMWTEYINNDLKFTIYTAEFIPGTEGTVILKNTSREYLKFTTNTKYNVGDIIEAYLENSPAPVLVGTGTIVFYNTTTKEAEVRIDNGQFFTNGVFGHGSVVRGTYIRKKKIINAISPTLSHLSFNNASVVWAHNIHESNGTENNEYSPLATVGTTELATERACFSYSEYNVSFKIKGILTTETRFLSPVIDLNKQSCIIAANEMISSSTVGYITRTVVLEDGQDAEDLRVYLSALVPSSTQVLVYAKVLHATDSTPFVDRPWTKMNINKKTSSPKFNEYYYTLSNSSVPFEYINKNLVLYRGFRTFAIKIVMIGSSTVQVPLIRDLRAIALLV